jgi:hypothetical protein
MPEYIITCEPGSEEKVENVIKASVGRLQLVMAMYMDVGYEKKEGKFYMRMRIRQPFLVAARAGGVDASTAITAMATQGMLKLNKKFRDEGIKAVVEDVVND